MLDFTVLASHFSTSLVDNDRRGAVRHLCSRVCYARPNGTSAGFTWGVSICDISQTGISVLLRCELQTGMILAIQPERGLDAEMLYARIVRTEPHAPGCWFYGCEFLRPLGEDDLQKWLGK